MLSGKAPAQTAMPGEDPGSIPGTSINHKETEMSLMIKKLPDPIPEMPTVMDMDHDDVFRIYDTDKYNNLELTPGTLLIRTNRVNEMLDLTSGKMWLLKEADEEKAELQWPLWQLTMQEEPLIQHLQSIRAPTAEIARKRLAADTMDSRWADHSITTVKEL